MHAFAKINITPLVDVMLVLLVIFMIAAPVLTRTIDLNLPGAAPPTSRNRRRQPIALRIDAGGTVVLERRRDAAVGVAADAAVGAAARSRQSAAAADRRQRRGRLRRVAKVLAAARNADWDRIAFVLE